MGKPQADKDEQFASSIESFVSIDLSYLLTRVFAGFLASSKEAGFVYGGYFASGTERKFDISTMA
jgi:hypothetical protein